MTCLRESPVLQGSERANNESAVAVVVVIISVLFVVSELFCRNSHRLGRGLKQDCVRHTCSKLVPIGEWNLEADNEK